jgi:hypothetical protein
LENLRKKGNLFFEKVMQYNRFVTWGVYNDISKQHKCSVGGRKGPEKIAERHI